MIKMVHFGYVKEQRKKERKGFVKRCYWPEESCGVVKIVQVFGSLILKGGGGNRRRRLTGP